MSKLWGGRFTKQTDSFTDHFHSSISFDQRMYTEDITGSIAHAGMLGAQGIIPKADAELIQKTLKEKHIEAALITSTTNHYYLTDFFASAALLATPDECWYFTDFRTIEAGEKHFEGSGVHLERADGGFVSCIKNLVEKRNISTLAVENNTLTVTQYENWKKNLPCQIAHLDGLVEELRHVKFPEEVANIITAQRIVEKSLHELLPLVKPGLREQDLVAELIYRFYKNGAEGLAFPVIILSGPNTSLPHGFPGNRVIENGDFITMDIGVKVGGYCSDMTRTFALGHATEEMKDVYQTVLQAQLAGIAAIAPGMNGHDTDKAARDIIDATQYAGTFGHGLGHSVGMICHDGQRAAQGSKDIFQVGNVITMEPGIYLPERFGCRIEDMVWLSPEGTTNLTEFPKELIIL